MNKLWEQLLALVMFFAFPILQYGLLKFHAAKEGQAMLWYLPAYGFRLVIRNLPRRKNLTGIRYRIIIRETVPPVRGCSVETYMDTVIHDAEDLFLFAGTDQVLLSFKLLISPEGSVEVTHTDKLGKSIKSYPLSSAMVLIADYEAMVENLFDFDVRIAKRTTIPHKELLSICQRVNYNNEEQHIELSYIKSIT